MDNTRIIPPSELIINADGSAFHIHLRPDQLRDNIILVGDPGRVDMVASYFDTIDYDVSSREFHAIAGSYKGKPIMCISHGIGPDNIEIVVTELDALANVDFQTRTVRTTHRTLNMVRIGTSGSLQDDIHIGDFSSAIESKVNTIAVVAHGLDTLYPAQHRDLARRIIASGGSIISQYPSGVQPFRANFLERNRIVAGLADATIIIESEIKGGAMSTARHAFEADREVLALPGRATDPISAGCNHLIRTQRASLISSAADLIELTGWQPLGLSIGTSQRSLFPELDGEANVIYEYLRQQPSPRLPDEIHHHTGIPVSRIIALLSDLEFDGVLLRHPGNRYAAILT